AARPGLALYLVAGAEAVLPQHSLTHVHVAAGGQISGFPAPQEPGAATRELEHAQHQRPATERLIRCRIAVSPWVGVMPRVSLRPSWSSRSSGIRATSSGAAPSSDRARSEMKPRTVGDSRGTSA